MVDRDIAAPIIGSDWRTSAWHPLPVTQEENCSDSKAGVFLVTDSFEVMPFGSPFNAIDLASGSWALRSQAFYSYYRGCLETLYEHL